MNRVKKISSIFIAWSISQKITYTPGYVKKIDKIEIMKKNLPLAAITIS